MDIMAMMNYNFDSGLNGKSKTPSILGEIQIKIAEVFVSNPQTKEDISKFESDLYGDSKVFGINAASYSSVDDVYPKWNELKENIIIKDLENNKSK